MSTRELEFQRKHNSLLDVINGREPSDELPDDEEESFTLDPPSVNTSEPESRGENDIEVTDNILSYAMILNDLEKDKKAYKLFEEEEELRNAAQDRFNTISYMPFEVFNAEAAWMHPIKKLSLWICSFSTKRFLFIASQFIPLMWLYVDTTMKEDIPLGFVVSGTFAIAGFFVVFAIFMMFLSFFVIIVINNLEPCMWFEVKKHHGAKVVKTPELKSVISTLKAHKLIMKSVHSIWCMFTVPIISVLFVPGMCDEIPMSWPAGFIIAMVLVYVFLNFITLIVDLGVKNSTLKKLNGIKNIIVDAHYLYEPLGEVNRYDSRKHHGDVVEVLDKKHQFLIFRRSSYNFIIGLKNKEIRRQKVCNDSMF